MDQCTCYELGLRKDDYCPACRKSEGERHDENLDYDDSDDSYEGSDVQT